MSDDGDRAADENRRVLLAVANFLDERSRRDGGGFHGKVVLNCRRGEITSVEPRESLSKDELLRDQGLDGERAG